MEAHAFSQIAYKIKSKVILLSISSQATAQFNIPEGRTCGKGVNCPSEPLSEPSPREPGERHLATGSRAEPELPLAI